MAGTTQKILILDDEEPFARMILDLLAEAGWEAEISTDPKQALALLKDEDFGLVVSDYRMPEMDGAEWLRKAREVHPHLPVIMVSGLMNTKDLVKVANIGVTLVLEKPFEATELLRFVARVLGPTEAEVSGATEQAPELEDFARDSEPAEAEEGYQPRILSVGSPATRTFAGDLARELPSGRVFLSLTRGAELDLIVQEAACILGEEDAKPLRLSVPELDQPDLAATITDALSRSRVILIACEHGEPVATLDLLEAFFARPDVPACGGADGPVYLLAFEREKLAKAGLTRALGEAPLLGLPPLRERPGDIGTYFRGALAAACEKHHREVPPFAAEAVRMLLAYGWPGDYHELVEAARYLALMARGREVTAALILRAIRHRRGQIDPNAAHALLADTLAIRQQELAPRFANNGDAPPEVDLNALLRTP